MMELSKRLQAVADLVTAHYKLADIGTDHAYIPIYLTQQKKITEAVALDVNEGPLQRAEDFPMDFRHYSREKSSLRSSQEWAADL